MTITFITGANKGLGYEAARRLIEAGHTVYLGARDPKRGADAAAAIGAAFVHIDVTDDDSVAVARQRLAEAGWTAEHVASTLDDGWVVDTCESRPRTVRNQDGEEATVHDAVLRAHRRT